MKAYKKISILLLFLFVSTNLPQGQPSLIKGKANLESNPSVVRTLTYHQVTSTYYYGVDGTPPILDEAGDCILFTHYTYEPRITHVMLASCDGNEVKELITMNDCWYDLQMDLSGFGGLVASSDEWNIYTATRNGTGFTKLLQLNENTIKGICVGGGSVFFRINNNTSRADIPGFAVKKGIWALGSDGLITQIVSAEDVAGTWGVTPDKVNLFGSINNRGGIDASTDGSKLTFVMYEPDAPGGEGQRLFSVNSDGTNLVSLTDRISWLQAFISPNGKKAAYLAIDKGYQYVGVVNTDGTDRKIIASVKQGDPSPFLTGFPDWGDRLVFNEDGSKLLLGGTGILCDTQTGEVLQLAMSAATPEPVAPEGMRFATMNMSGNRFGYLIGKYQDQYHLAYCDLNPIIPGNAPAPYDININPDYVLTNQRSYATITARVNTTMQLKNVACSFLHNGLRDVYVCVGDRTPPQLMDDGTEDDAVAGDGIYTNGNVYALNEASVGPKTVRIKVEGKDSDGRRHAMAMDLTPFEVSENATDVADDKYLLTNFDLFQNYPNPFNPVTTIKYSIPTSPLLPLLTKESVGARLVTLKVYDVLGCEIATLVNEEKKPGSYEVIFNADFSGGGLPSGIYFYRMQAGGFIQSRKMILMK